MPDGFANSGTTATGSVQLRRRFRELGEWMVYREEGLVLCAS